MTHRTDTETCQSCAFHCDGICDATSSKAFRAARAQVNRHLPFDDAALERHYRYLVAAICRMTGRFDFARDLAQDVFVKALTSMDGFRYDAQRTTWLFAIARNRCFDYLKARASTREVGEDALAAAPPMVDNTALRALEQVEARRIVARLLNDAVLGPLERRAFVLHYGGGLPIETVTRELRLRNRSGAKAQIVSARRKLGRALTRWRGRALRPR
jgi:RNA polymerase sigma-70 factor, ECF subfamily